MLKSIELRGFKSFAKKTELHFPARISAIVGPNGSGKSNTAEAFRFALGEQSMKSLRGKRSDDLLFNGSSSTPRANRAGVRVTFNNSNNALNVDFDEVAIERVMHRDSSHQYFVNDSQVRLKDILELLAGANIGSTGHHIISQGEADRILRVKPSERKIIIEDALGLKMYHYKKRESINKLQKTKDNLNEIQGSLREITPRLNYLQKQVSKIEKAQSLKDELLDLSVKYFASRAYTIEEERSSLSEEKEGLKKEHKECGETMEKYKKAQVAPIDFSSEKEKLSNLEKEISDYDLIHKEKERALGRVEGQLELYIRKQKPSTQESSVLRVDVKELRYFVDKIIEMASTFSSEDFRSSVDELFKSFVNKDDSSSASEEDTEEEKRELEKQKLDIQKEIEDIKDKKFKIKKEEESLRSHIEESASKSNNQESLLLDLKDHEREIDSRLSRIEYRLENLDSAENDMKEDLVDAGISFGKDISRYRDQLLETNFSPLSNEEQKESYKKIERGKIRIEEANLGASKDIENEYNQLKERCEFLEKEIQDLTHTRSSLDSLVKELDRELKVKFEEGMEKINKEFNRFFSIIFGGGGAYLTVTEEETTAEAGQERRMEVGVDIDVELPRKRVKGLTMLSGGERSLTSIALIFAISQINPPPFLILDETDAALDEANSRRYGDMIESLSEKSQLILVTHNRETMARAGLLYGVTMGADGVSRVLSVKFDDAKDLAAR